MRELPWIRPTALAFSLLVSSAAPPRERGGTSATALAAAVELDLRGLEPLDPGVRAELVSAIHRALASTPAELVPATIGLGGAAIVAGSAMAIVDSRDRHRTHVVTV